MNPMLSRRTFIQAAATGTAALAASSNLRGTTTDAKENWPALPSVKIHKVYVGRSGVAWPKPAFDPRAEVAKFEKKLTEIQNRLGDVRFVGGELVQTKEEATRVAAGLRDADGVLLFHLSINMLNPMQILVDANLPTVIFSQPFSGHEWMFINRWRKAGRKVALLATSDYGEIEKAVAVLRVPAQMRQSRILAIPGPLDGSAPARDYQKIKDRLGSEVIGRDKTFGK